MFRTLFDHLHITMKLPAKLLNMQYRMHPAIAEWPNQSFYGGQLVNGAGVSTTAVNCGLGWPRHPSRLTWTNSVATSAEPVVDVAALAQVPVVHVGMEDGAGEKKNAGSPSWFNSDEASKAMDVAHALLEGVDIKSVALLAPYAAQVRFYYCFQWLCVLPASWLGVVPHVAFAMLDFSLVMPA
jgi:superfamily I DNA and/or RNA helicase